MTEECKHENNARSHMDLNDAAGDERLTQLWYECTVCGEEIYIELRMDFKQRRATVIRMNESHSEELE
jgi:hypothetical protein|tara:strand:+ start:417 stop:620 length:204 start_codon:yes stop_codon:yes gene_type:complete